MEQTDILVNVQAKGRLPSTSRAHCATRESWIGIRRGTIAVSGHQGVIGSVSTLVTHTAIGQIALFADETSLAIALQLTLKLQPLN